MRLQRNWFYFGRLDVWIIRKIHFIYVWNRKNREISAKSIIYFLDFFRSYVCSANSDIVSVVVSVLWLFQFLFVGVSTVYYIYDSVHDCFDNKFEYFSPLAIHWFNRIEQKISTIPRKSKLKSQIDSKKSSSDTKTNNDKDTDLEKKRKKRKREKSRKKRDWKWMKFVTKVQVCVSCISHCIRQTN